LRSVELQYGSTNDDLNVKDVFFYNYSIHQLIIQPEKKKSIEIDWFILYIYACLRFLPKKRKKKEKKNNGCNSWIQFCSQLGR